MCVCAGGEGETERNWEKGESERETEIVYQERGEIGGEKVCVQVRDLQYFCECMLGREV